MIRSLTALAAAAVALALASCGGSGDTTSSTSESTSTTPSRLAHYRSFQAAGGNIGCTVNGGRVRCDIRKRTWSPPPRPSSCPKEVDFGQGIEVGAGDAGFVCAGDTALNPSAPDLASGKATSGAGIVCTALANLITCTNQDTGHGFTMSSASYKVF